VKLLRQAVVVLGVVAVIMALGFAMKHTPAASLVTDGRTAGRDAGRLTPASAAPSGRFRPFDGHDGGRNDQGFDVSRADDLVQSLVILGLIIAGVVVIDKMRRRRAPIVDARRSVR
jgi:hypothetical protein